MLDMVKAIIRIRVSRTKKLEKSFSLFLLILTLAWLASIIISEIQSVREIRREDIES